MCVCVYPFGRHITTTKNEEHTRRSGFCESEIFDNLSSFFFYVTESTLYYEEYLYSS